MDMDLRDGEGQESYGPRGHKEMDTTKWLNNTLTESYILTFPTTFLEQFLRDIRGALSWAAVLICPK